MKKMKFLILLGWLFIVNHTIYAQNCTVNAGTDQTICVSSQFTLTGSAGLPTSPPPLYQWTKISGPAATFNTPNAVITYVTNFAPGDYVFQLTSRCADNILATDLVSVKVLPTPISLAGPDQTICQNTTGSQLAANAVVAPQVGTWTASPSGGTFSPNANAPNAIYTPPTGANIYTLTWTISNGTCSTSDEMKLSVVAPAVTVNAGPDINLSCSGSCATMNASSPGLTPPNGGFWTLTSGPNVPVIASPSSRITSVCGLIAGTYTFKWTVTGPCNTGSDEMNIIVNNILEPPLADPSVFYPRTCNTLNNIVLNGKPLTAGETGLWTTSGSGITYSPNNTVSNPVVSNLPSGFKTFTYTRTNAAGCTSSTLHYVENVSPVTNLVISPNQDLACGNTSTTFDVTYDNNFSNITKLYKLISGPFSNINIGSAGTTYNGTTQTDTWSVSNLALQGTYLIQIEYQTECGTQFKTIAITTSIMPGSVNAGSDPIIPCNATVANPIGSVNGAGLYIWSQVSGPNMATLLNQNTLSLNMSNLISGVYNMRLTLSGGKTCPAISDNMIVKVASSPPPTATTGVDKTICTGNIQLAANTPNATDNGVWTVTPSAGLSFLPNANTPNAILSGMQASTTYTLRWTITNSCGSTFDEQILTTTSVNGPALPNAGLDACLPNGTTTKSLTGSTPGASNTVSWTALTAGSSVSPTNTQNATATFTGGPGTYRFVYTLGVAGCASLTDTVAFTVNQSITANAGADFDFCASTTPAIITLNATTPPAGTTGTWSNLSGPASITITSATSASTTVTGLLPGVYEFEYRISTGGICPDVVDNVIVRVTAGPSAANAGPDQSVCNVTTATVLTLAATAPTVGTGSWSIVSGPKGSSDYFGLTAKFSDPLLAASKFSLLSIGTYTLRWTVSNGPGCANSTDDVIISVSAAANAGSDFNLCNSTATTLSGNQNAIGTWSFISGPAGYTLTTITSSKSIVSNLVAPGTYTFRYTVAAVGACLATTDDVTFINYPAPSQAFAGADKQLCFNDNTVTLTGNTPTNGIGTWNYISGPPPVPALSGTTPNITLTSLMPGLHVLQYSINTNSACVASTDNVQIIKETIAAAGVDIRLCSVSTISLNATPGIVNVGTWSLTSGPNTPVITNINTPNSTVTNLIPGTYVFKWTLAGAPGCIANFDEVTVIIDAPVPTLNAGSDIIVCQNASDAPILLGTPAISGITYLWSPNTNLNNATIAQPTFTGAGNTGTFVYTLQGSNGSCVAFDAVTVTVNFCVPLTIAGTIYNDITGLTDAVVSDGLGLGNPSSTAVYANLLNADGTTVVASVLVNNDGTYVLPVSANTTYIVQISTNQGTAGQPTPATALPIGWVNTGDVNPTDPTATAATPGLSAPVEVVTANVTTVDFGIQQAPETAVNLQPSQVNPTGTNSVTVPASAFQTSNVGANPNTDDPSTGTVASINIPTFPAGATSITVGSTTYLSTDPIWATGGITIPYTDGVGPNQVIKVDPIDGAGNVVIPIVAIDNAGVKDPTAGSVTMQFTSPALTLSGTIYNDITGLTDAVVSDGLGLGNPSSTAVYANLLSADGTTVVASVLVNNDGTYVLPVSANTTYIVQISTNQGTAGQPTPATALPIGWVNTGDVNPTDPTATAATPGLSAPVEVVTANVTTVDFGIQQAPETAVSELANQINPGGTASLTIPASAFQTSSNIGTNPNTGDQSGGTITSINIPTFPTGATSITIGATTYTSGTWPMGGVTIPYTNGVGPDQVVKVDPVDGDISVVITIVAIDNAGIKDPTPGSITIPFAKPLPVTLINFNGVQLGEAVSLTWKTANEKAFSHFVIERSQNAKEFGSIGQVKGTSQGIYNMTDNNPVTGANYYRLKMVDQDGTYNYSKIINVSFEAGANYVIVENPVVNSEIKVQTNMVNPEFSLLNTLGQKMTIRLISNDKKEYKFALTNINNGIYFLNISSNGILKTKKILVKE
jgi:hypothetical protein